LPTKCVGCAEPHKAQHCDRPYDLPTTCVNCGEDLAANWRGCSLCLGSKKALAKTKFSSKKMNFPAQE
ncbi:hypothetical protein CDAR_304261, partial [Caerostris darwini]